MRMSWLRDHYVNIAREVVAETSATKGYQPEVTPSDLPATEQEHAAEVLSRISSILGKSIEAEAEREFEAFWLGLPRGLGMERASARRAWMLENFYRIAGAMAEGKPVVRSSGLEVVAPVFEPAVPLVSLSANAQAVLEKYWHV